MTLALILQHADIVLRPQIETALQRVKNATEFARDWRNRHIAHQDFSLVFSDTAEPLASLRPNKVSDAIAEINNLLNLVVGYYGGGHIAFDRLIAGGQADDLVQVLNEEFQREQDFRRRQESGSLTEGDLFRKFRDRI